MNSLTCLLETQPFILLDGGTGTELERRGFPLTSPDWSAAAVAQAPGLLADIHSDYVQAGADIITANTFRTRDRDLVGTRFEGQSGILVEQAVETARAASGSRALVAGSLSPVADCYTPAACPATHVLESAHDTTARHLARAGVDLILVETQNSILEARIALRAARLTGLPAVISFVCGRPSVLLSGESLADGIQAVQKERPCAILINCSPLSVIDDSLATVSRHAPNLARGAYPNAGEIDDSQNWIPNVQKSDEHMACAAARWHKNGARLIGGCCYTTPTTISKLRAQLDHNSR